MITIIEHNVTFVKHLSCFLNWAILSLNRFWLGSFFPQLEIILSPLGILKVHRIQSLKTPCVSFSGAFLQQLPAINNEVEV